MVKNLKKILSVLCVVLMTATVFSAAVMNVLADENDGEEKTFVSLNPCVATNEYIHIVWQENVSNYEIFYCNNIYETGNYENTLRNVISQVEDLSAEDEDYEDVLSDLEESLEKCTEGDYKHSMDEIHDAVKDLEKIGNTEIINTLIDAVRDFAKTNILYAEYYLAFNNTYIQEAYQKYELALEKRRDGNYDACIKQFKNSYLKLKEAYEEMETDNDNDDEIGLIGIDFGEIIRISYTDHDSVNPQIYLNGTIHVGWKEILDDVPHVEYARSKNNGYTWFYFDATKHAAVYLNYCSINPSIVSIENTIAITQTLERIYTLERCHYFYVPIREPYPVPPPSGAKTFYTTMNDVHGGLHDHYEAILIGDKYFYKPICGPGGDPNPEPEAPDLTVSDISLYEGHMVATVQNQGTATASGVIKTEFYKEGELLGSNESQYYLQSDKYMNIPIGWLLPIKGVEVKVVIDPDNNASDGNIDNNDRYENTTGDTYRSGNGTQPWYHYFGEDNNIMRSIGAKVNTANGNLYLSKKDFKINDGGFGIKIVRSYNSHRSNIQGVFGNGWTHNYNIYLIKNNDNSITVVNGDGSTYTFTVDADGNYVSPAGVNSKLTKANSLFTLWFNDGIRYNFNSQNKIESIMDKKDNNITFSYTDNRLTKVKDNWGLSITINYNVEGRISSIIYPPSREIKYEYDISGNLTKVTDAMGYFTTYRYYKNNYLKDIIDPEGGMTSFTYYDYPRFDRVKEITRSMYGFVTGTFTNTFRVKLFDYSIEDSAAVDERDAKSRVEVDKEGKPVSVVRPWHVIDFPRERISWDENLNKVGYVDANGNAYAYEYDTYGNLIKETNPTSKTMVYGRENIDISMQYVSLLKSKTDELGHITTYNYDEPGVLIKKTDPTGNTTEYTYQLDLPSDSKVLVSKTDKNKVQTIYTYDSYGNKIKEQDSLGTTIEYSYDDAGRIASRADGNAQTTSYTYDANDKITKVTDSSGEATYTYNKNGDLTSVIDKNGNPTNIVWNVSLNKVEKIVDAFGNERINGYDKNGNLVKTIDENGHATIYEYDDQNRLIKTIDALGHSTITTYDNIGNMVSVTNKNGYITEYGYDELNREIWERDALGHITKYSYNDVGNLISETNAKGYITTYKYDELDRMIEKIDANGVSWFYSYDANDNLIAETDGNGYTTTYSYDDRNQVISVTDPMGHKTAYEYDNAGNQIKYTDANSRVVTYTYNGLNQVTNVTDALGGITSYCYDANGNLIMVMGANSNPTSLVYDALSRVTKITSPLGFATSYVYDGVGNVVSKTDANGNTVSYSYDALNWINRITYPDGSYKTFSYDPESNILRSSSHGTGQDSRIDYTWDAKNRIVSTTTTIGTLVLTVKYEYDEVGNRIKMTDPIGGITTYRYDSLNRLTHITEPSGAITVYIYDNAGRRIRRDYPNNVFTVYSYDAASRLLKTENVKGGGAVPNILSSYEYTYDAVGNRLTMLESNGDETTYVYDSNYRLVSVSYPSGKTFSYTYDNSGNRIEERMETITTWNHTYYCYDEDNRLIRTVLYIEGVKGIAEQVDYSYDNNGNLISKTEDAGPEGITTTDYVYDYENKLTRIITPEGNIIYDYYVNCPILCDWSIDMPLGKRMSTTSLSGETIYSLYDWHDKMQDRIMDFDALGNLIARYTHNHITFDEPISMQTAMGIFYYLFDGLGSVTGLTDCSGNLVASYSYDTFGNILSETGDATVNTINPYRFTSRVYDKESGLYYYRARYYDANVGRFTQKDPLREALNNGENLYVYCRNNPVNYKDPMGTWCIGLSAAMAAMYKAIRDPLAKGHKYGWRAHCYVGIWMHRFGCSYWQTRIWGTIPEVVSPLGGGVFSTEDIAAVMWGWKKYNTGGRYRPHWWSPYLKYRRSAGSISTWLFPGNYGSIVDVSTIP